MSSTEKGFLQKISGRKLKGSNIFPYVKRGRSATSNKTQPEPSHKKGNLQKISKGKFKGSNIFPYVKRGQYARTSTSKAEPSVINKSSRTIKSKPKQSVINKSSKSVKFMQQLKKPLSEKKVPSNRSRILSFFKLSKPKEIEQNDQLSTIIRIIKYFILFILFLLCITNFIYIFLYIQDYSKNNLSLENKNLLKISIIRSIILFLISIIMLLFVNSYWKFKIIDDAFSIPVSINLRQ